MSVASELRQDLLMAMEGYRREIKLTRQVKEGYDPQTQTTRDDFPVEYRGQGRLGNYSDRLVDGTLIRKGDRLCTFVPDDVAACPDPLEGDLVSNGFEELKVVASKKREVDGEVICHTMQVRNV